ncbi:Methenyltetrahydromethanopterin cyclohydrolase [Thalassoglobus neptunius]|uniref:Methenyltetrahydromethanopterin cyclohydrolase n=1 Tax=Thalassoglobus neptunius TaxID=1938619 RepID=A0A5C5X6Z4_9PLAN|nr:methenyltetrahydromethanopterin cyclohydrolase [Thalassoglobus neptunius]TWT58419.1 Methenyltetrahydromethanopterin cyclohydrolase [Thalassoglobus neptunius]
MNHDEDDWDGDLFEDEPSLNHQAWDLIQQVLYNLDELRVEPALSSESGIVLDFGVNVPGSLSAGLTLAEISCSGLSDFSMISGELAGIRWPHIFVQTDDPVESCLLSQYAGWQLQADDYFAMASGPMRTARGSEPLFETLRYQEVSDCVVGVLEAAELPTDEVIQKIAEECNVPVDGVAVLVAPTSSIAGNFQVVGRSVETAMHKLFELGFDVSRVESACGSAPISPVAADDLTGIGRTNDAILYGGSVTLWVHGDDEMICELGPKVPASASEMYGRPFVEIFEAAGRDFYQIDPHLFSPGEVVFHNVETGSVFQFGHLNSDVLIQSFHLNIG